MSNRIYFKKFHFCARYDTAENWETYNPTLYAGEAGVVKDGTAAGWFKIGDGETAWNDLPFLGVVEQEFDATSDNAQSGVAIAGALKTCVKLATGEWLYQERNNNHNGEWYQCTYTYTSGSNTYTKGYIYEGIALSVGGIIRYNWIRRDTQPNPDLSGYALKSELPTKTSQLTNDSGFITKAVADLTNYYLKSETYTKTEVNSLISAISTMSFEVVQTLPVSDIQTDVIYLVPKSSAQSQNVYDEYIYINNAWEKIGDTQIDLSGYATKVSGAVSGNFAGLDSNGNLIDSGKKASDFALSSDLSSKENIANKVTALSAQSTDTQYPSAKCVYDLVNPLIPNIKPSLDNVLLPNAMYDLGSTDQSSLTLTLPEPLGTKTVTELNDSTLTKTSGDIYILSDSGTLTAGNLVVVAGDWVQWNGTAWIKINNYSCNDIYIAFKSGPTATTLSILGTYAGDTSYLPSANSICELSFKYVCGTWVLVTKETPVS